MIDALKNFSIDKSDWTPVKFGDVVYEPRVSVKDPGAAGIEHVVGLEHIDSEDIHLRRSASIEDGTTFTKKFDVGDVLFGRRRAYLKKAAKADFSGICSGDIIVMRAKENLLPDLLPFIVNNDNFFDFAIKHSAGGLSPRVKFKDLAEYEFLLPPIKIQSSIVNLLQSCDQTTQTTRRSMDLAAIVLQSLREREMFQPIEATNRVFNRRLKRFVSEGIEFSRLEDFVTLVKYGTSKKGNNNFTGYKSIGIPNVINERLSVNKTGFVDLKNSEYASCKLYWGDIVIVRTNGNPDYTGRSALYNLNEGHVFASYLIKVSPIKEIMDPEFLSRYLQTKTIRRFFRRHATSTAGNYNINSNTIKSVPVPNLKIEAQREVVKKLKFAEHSLDKLTQQTALSVDLNKSFTNQF